MSDRTASFVAVALTMPYGAAVLTLAAWVYTQLPLTIN